MKTENNFGEGSMDDVLSLMEGDLKGQKFQNPFWNPPSDYEGTIKIRFLPLLKTFQEKIFYFKRRVHWMNRKPYMCLAQTLVDKNGKVHEAEECPICAMVKKLYAVAGDNRESEDAKLASSIKANDRYISRIVVRGRKNEKNEDVENIPVFYEYGKTIFEALLNFIKSGEFGDFLSVGEGRDFNLVKSGKGRNAKYAGSYLAGTQTPVFSDKEKLKILLEELQKMDYKQLVEFTSAEQMKKDLNEFLNGDSGEDQTVNNAVKLGAPVEEKVQKAFERKEEKDDEEGDEIDNLLSQF